MIRNRFIKTFAFILIIAAFFCLFPAYAADDSESIPEEAEFSGIRQYISSKDPDDRNKYILTPITEDDAGETHFISDSGSETAPEKIEIVKDLSGLMLTVSPTTGKYVKGIYLSGDSEFILSEDDFNLISLCSASRDSADVEFDFSLLTTEAFNKSNDDDYSDYYYIVIVFEERPSKINYEYSIDGKDFKPEDFSLEEPFTGAVSDDFQLSGINEENNLKNIKESGYRFGGWKITYSNNASVIIRPDEFEEFSPVMSFSAEPVADKGIIVIILKDREKAFQGEVPVGDKYNVSERETDDYEIVSASERTKLIYLSTEITEPEPVENHFEADIIVRKVTVSTSEDGETTSFEQDFPDWIYVYPAKLSLTKASLTITAKSASMKYDGTALTCPEIEEPVGLEGSNKLDTAGLIVSGSRIDIGSSENIAAGAKVLSDETGSATDVSDFYNITYVPGTISISPPDPREIIISPASDKIEKTYRGDGITPDASGSQYYSLSGELYPTDTIIVHSSLFYSPVWVEGSFNYAISDFSVLRNNLPLENYSDYYNIIIDNSVYGLLQVKKNSISIIADSYSKPYDGNIITKNSYSQTGALYEGDKLSITVAPAQQLNKVGKTDNLVSSCIVTDASGRDVSDFYNFDVKSGTLEITPRELTITVKNVTREYNGQLQSVSGADDITLSTPLPNSPDSKYHYEMSLDTIGSLKDIGSTEVGLTVNKIFLFDSNQNREIEEVTDQFSIKVVPGKLTITPRTLTIKTKSVSMQYSGAALTDSSTPEIIGKLEGDKITIKYTGSQTSVGSSSNSCSVIKIVNANEQDVLKNYNIVYNYGKLTVYSNSGTSGAPLTGDENNPVLLLCLIISSVSGILAISVLYNRKFRH